MVHACNSSILWVQLLWIRSSGSFSSAMWVWRQSGLESDSKQKWAGEMVEEAKVLTAKTNGLSLSLVIQMVELTYMLKCICTQKTWINKNVNKNNPSNQRTSTEPPQPPEWIAWRWCCGWSRKAALLGLGSFETCSHPVQAGPGRMLLFLCLWRARVTDAHLHALFSWKILWEEYLKQRVKSWEMCAFRLRK